MDDRYLELSKLYMPRIDKGVFRTRLANKYREVSCFQSSRTNSGRPVLFLSNSVELNIFTFHIWTQNIDWNYFQDKRLGNIKEKLASRTKKPYSS
jgi:hypothetical protein